MTPIAVRALRALAGAALAAVLAGCTGAAPPPVPQPPATEAAPSPPTTGPAADPRETRILAGPDDAVIGRYGTRTRATFFVRASGTKLAYRWQYRKPGSGSWRTIAKATSARYTATAAKWASGTKFRVLVTGGGGRVASAAVTLTVLRPSATPAKDAEQAFGLTGLRQGLDLSAYQYTPAGRVKLQSVAEWTGPQGFTILRNGSGARPIRARYTDACTNAPGEMGGRPVTEDCAYSRLADAAGAAGLSLGHYWFNGWIASIDKTRRELFAGGYTPEDSARQFVKWLKRDGNYTRASTDPLVLDVEAGSTWTRTYKGKKYKAKLRAWRPAEAKRFLTTVKETLNRDGYQANLYVYLNANATLSEAEDGSLAWAEVAGIARLWVAAWGTNNGRIPPTLPSVGPWAYEGGWSIWQYTSNARVAGSGVGSMDGDVAKADAWTPR